MVPYCRFFDENPAAEEEQKAGKEHPAETAGFRAGAKIEGGGLHETKKVMAQLCKHRNQCHGCGQQRHARFCTGSVLCQ